MSDTIATRFVTLGIHKHYAVIAAVDKDVQVVLKPRRVSYDRLSQWAMLAPPEEVRPWLGEKPFREGKVRIWWSYSRGKEPFQPPRGRLFARSDPVPALQARFFCCVFP